MFGLSVKLANLQSFVTEIGFELLMEAVIIYVTLDGASHSSALFDCWTQNILTVSQMFV